MSKVASLDVTDPNFSFIAAGAAVEVDRLRLGHDIVPKNAIKLSNILDVKELSSSEDTGGVRSLFDPLSSQVVNRALIASQKDSTRSLQELAEKAEEISQSLSIVNQETENLEILRDFCIALSKLSLGTRNSRMNSRNSNPRKKVLYETN